MFVLFVQILIEDLGENYQKDGEFTLGSFTSTTTRVEVMNTFLGEEGPRVMLHLNITEPVARDVN